MSPKKNLKIGIVGATGMVGQSFLQILAEKNISPVELRLFASEGSIGKTIDYAGKLWPVQKLAPGCFKGLDLVFFSSGDEISKEWAPQAVRDGAWAVDNSAAFRMDPETPLIVPEVNGHLIKKLHKPQIIANPNCSTIQLVVVLKPLAQLFGIESVKVSTYQAVSGAGQVGPDTLMEAIHKKAQGLNVSDVKGPFAHSIGFNCIPEIGGYKTQGYFSEEVKIIQETKKILELPALKVSAFAVRVPVLNCHAETLWVKLKSEASYDQVLASLENFSGIVVKDKPEASVYPLQSEISGKDPVYVGRIHNDPEDPATWLMWIVSDNIRKGAALNGLQIAERIFDIH